MQQNVVVLSLNGRPICKGRDHLHVVFMCLLLAATQTQVTYRLILLLRVPHVLGEHGLSGHDLLLIKHLIIIGANRVAVELRRCSIAATGGGRTARDVRHVTKPGTQSADGQVFVELYGGRNVLCWGVRDWQFLEPGLITGPNGHLLVRNSRKTDFAGRSMGDPCQWRVSVKSRLKILRLPFHLLGRGI